MNPGADELENDFPEEKPKKRLINPGLVDAVAQAERETRAIEEKSKAIWAQHHTSFPDPPTVRKIAEATITRTPVKEPMQSHNWQPITPETLPDHGFSILILLKKEGNLGEEHNQILVARTEFGVDGFGRPIPLHFGTYYLDKIANKMIKHQIISFGEVFAWHPLPDVPYGLFK